MLPSARAAIVRAALSDTLDTSVPSTRSRVIGSVALMFAFEVSSHLGDGSVRRGARRRSR